MKKILNLLLGGWLFVCLSTQSALAIWYGEDVDITEVPWQVFVSIPNAYCGGTIIGHQWILTAAHCLYDEDGEVLAPGDVTVKVGVTDRTATSEQNLTVVNVIVHPNYRPFSWGHLKNGSDIALLEIAGAIEFNDRVQAIRYATPNESGFGIHGIDGWGRVGLLTGWGEDENGEYPVHLQKVSLPIIPTFLSPLEYGIFFRMTY